ncbi:hypothetical protein Q7I30_19055 [Aeromonas veronii]
MQNIKTPQQDDSSSLAQARSSSRANLNREATTSICSAPTFKK